MMSTTDDGPINGFFWLEYSETQWRNAYSTLKGLNMKRSNERSEIIAPGETWGTACQKSLNPERVEYETK